MKNYVIYVSLNYRDIGIGGLLDDMVRSNPDELKRLITSQAFANSIAYNRYLNLFMIACRNSGYNPTPTKIKFMIYGYHGTTADLNDSYGGFEFEFTPLGDI